MKNHSSSSVALWFPLLLPLVTAFALMIFVSQAAAGRTSGRAVFSDPAPNFSFLLDANYTSWEFQLDLPNYTFAEFPAWQIRMQRTLKQYAENSSAKVARFKFHEHTAFYDKTVLSYWHIPVESARWLLKSYSIVESAPPVTGDNQLTLKLKHVPVNQWPILPDCPKNVYQKMENDVHCAYNNGSKSIEAKKLKQSSFGPFTNVSQLEEYYGPSLCNYLHVDPSQAIEPLKTVTGLETCWKCDFVVYYTAKNVSVPCKACLQSEQTNADVKNGLSIRIKRAEVEHPSHTLIPSLSALKELMRYLYYTFAPMGATCPAHDE